VGDRVEGGGFASATFVAHVDRRGRILADKDDGEARCPLVLSQPRIDGLPDLVSRLSASSLPFSIFADIVGFWKK